MKYKMFKRIIAIGILLVSTNINGQVLHTISEPSIITKGVILNQDKHLVADGWLDVNVLKIDLSEELFFSPRLKTHVEESICLVKNKNFQTPD